MTNDELKAAGEVQECNSEDGITVGLIDTIMTCAAALKGRPGVTMDRWETDPRFAVYEAMRDLAHNAALRELLHGCDPIMQPASGEYTVGDLVKKLKRLPSGHPVILGVDEDYSGPARIVSLEPQGYVVISDGR